jgi:hypothetical protein
VVGVMLIGVDPGSFWSQMQGGVDVWRTSATACSRAWCSASTVTFIALLQGFEAHPTPEGVSRATTRTVVVGSLSVLARFRADGDDVQHLRGEKTMERTRTTSGWACSCCIGAAASCSWPCSRPTC